MSTRGRRWLGAALLVTSLVTAVAVDVAGVPPVSIVHPDTPPHDEGQTWFDAYIVTFRWQYGILLAVAVVGLLLLLLPKPIDADAPREVDR